MGRHKRNHRRVGQNAPYASPRAAAVTVLILVLLLVGWLAVRAVQARSALLQAKAGLTTAVEGVRGGDLGSNALGELSRARSAASDDVGRARAAVDDPVWRLAAAVPLLGRSFAVTRDATLVVERVVDGVLPPLLDGARTLQEGQLFGDGRVDLALLEVLSGQVDEADSAAVAAEADARRISARSLPGPLQELRADLVGQVERLAAGTTSARSVTDIAPAMLGAGGPRRYFLAVQNNAEVRGTGGLIGAYAVLGVDGGALSLERTGTNLDLKNAPAPVADLGPEFNERYDGQAARSSWTSAVRTPDWPSAATIMAGLWARQGGGKLDGVIGVDPLAMAQVLAVTGPAQVNGRTIGAGNVVDFVMRDEYAEFPGADIERKEVLEGLASGLYTSVAAGAYEAPAMLNALRAAAGGGHLQIWSARPEEQAVIAPFRASGSILPGPGAYLQVVSVNIAGNKADYYVRREVSYARTAPGEATASVSLTNTVVASAVPPIVTGRLDETRGPRGPLEPGQTRQAVSIYAGEGQVVRRMLVDGVEVPADLGTERGHGVGTVEVELRTSRPTVVTAEMTDPGGLLTYRQQPLVVDDTLQMSVPFVVG